MRELDTATSSETSVPSLAATTPSSWISLFSPQSKGNKNEFHEDDSGVAMFIGNASLFQSPPAKEIRLRNLSANNNIDDVTPLLTRSSPVTNAVSSTEEASRSHTLAENEVQHIPEQKIDYAFYVEQFKACLRQGKIYLQQGRDFVRQTSQSPTRVTAFFYFNVLWTLLGLSRYVFVTSAPIRIVTP
jgi:hypothetical protein